MKGEDDALAAGTAVVLDSQIPPLDKIAVARDILVAVNEAEAEARIPDVGDVDRQRGRSRARRSRRRSSRISSTAR